MSECPYCINSFEMTETCHDEFRMWQGLVGPYYIPTIEDGILTWTNTGGLPNPNPINIIGAQGNGLYIGGIAETTGDLPETAENGVTWLVGADEPYEGYVYLNGSWVDIGAVTPGPTGPQGIPGVGVPSGGTTGQVLQKASNSDYQTEWTDPASGGDPPGTMLPLMDGTAAVGTARSYAREDHVHPQDSEIGELKTSISDVKSNVAFVEDGNTATQAIDKWRYVIWKGNLYISTQPISIGTTLSNSNLTAVNNGGLNALGAINDASLVESSGIITPITPSTGSNYQPYGNSYFYKVGTLVHVHIGLSGITANANNDIYTLPVGYRPYTQVSVAGNAGTSYTAHCHIAVLETGLIRVSSTDTYAIGDIEFHAFN